MVAAGMLYFLAVIIFFRLGGSFIKKDPKGAEAVLALNDITEMAEEKGLSADVFSGKDFGADFAVLDSKENVIYSSCGDDEKITLNRAIMNRYPYSYVMKDDAVAGYVIVTQHGRSTAEGLIYSLTVVFAVCGLIMLTAVTVAGLYIRKNIILPFKRMEEFAGRVAEGQFDEPLPMDRDNLFGAFSESFDIMREELSRSRERELELQKKERELVASLSHDLKTPVTGIKLSAELLKAKMSVGETDIPDIIDKADNIYSKADQIDVLVSDLFDSVLDDLGQFRVSCEDLESGVISGIIKKYDDRDLVREDKIPEVIVSIDEKRMGQVIGNIISNSEKYAGTPIDVSYVLKDRFLQMRISDTGPGIPSDETELVMNKFYRGRQWKDSDKAGNGLGLYIARTLMELMGGKLVIEQPGKGFCAVLLIPLA